jgi:hypothetical protein
MNIPAKGKLLAIGLAGVLAVGATGIVLAQDPGGDGEDLTPREHLRRDVRVVIGVHAIVEASGLDGTVFREGFAAGQTINEVLTANGLDPAAVKAEVLANLEDRLAARVADGGLEQAKADEILANAAVKLDELMASVPDGDGEHRHPVFKARLGLLESAAEFIGVEVDELVAELRETDGTVASVAEAHGVDVDALIDSMVADATIRINEAVANGDLDVERAEEITSGLEEKMTNFVNEGPRVRPHGGMRPFRGGEMPSEEQQEGPTS